MTSEDIRKAQKEQTAKLHDLLEVIKKNPAGLDTSATTVLTHLDMAFWLSEIALQLALLREDKGKPVSEWERVFGHKANEG